MKIQSLKNWWAVIVLTLSFALGQQTRVLGQCPSGIAGLSGSVLNSSIQAYPGFPNSPAHFIVFVNDNSQPIPMGQYLSWCVDETGNIEADYGFPPTSFYTGVLFPDCDANLNSELPPGHTP